MTFQQLEKFVKAINTFYDRQNQFDKAFEPFNSSYTAIEFCPEITNVIFDYIKESFNDEGDWFGYWYWELEQGERWVPDSCYHMDGTPITLKTLEDVYNFMEENRLEEETEA